MNSFGPATRLLTLRRATGHRPVIISAAKLPSSLTRWITIRPPNEAPGEGPGSNSNTNISAPGSSSSASGSSDFQLVNHSLSISSSTSQHPFSEVLSNSGDPSSSSTVVTTSNPHSRSSHLPPPPDDIDPIPPTHFQHPFDTHAFVSYLEKSGLNSGSAVTLMHAVRELIVRRGEITKMNLVGKEDMENVRKSDPNSICFTRSIDLLTLGRILVPRSSVGTANGTERPSAKRRRSTKGNVGCHTAWRRLFRAEDERGCPDAEARVSSRLRPKVNGCVKLTVASRWT